MVWGCRRAPHTSLTTRSRAYWNLPTGRVFGWRRGPPDEMASAPGGSGSGSGAPAEKKVEKSYLASAVDSINPWNTSRSSTPTPKEAPKPPPPKPKPTQDAPRKADDHSTNPIYGQSFKRYPPECPPLNVMWFHAIDVGFARPMRPTCLPNQQCCRSRSASRSSSRARRKRRRKTPSLQHPRNTWRSARMIPFLSRTHTRPS